MNEQSAEHRLADALAQLQADLPKIVKDKTAKVPTKDGGAFSYKYSDLGGVTEALLPALGRHGLSFSAKPILTDDGAFVLRYLLRHTSGESDGGDWPLPDPGHSTPQQIGSAITYARRYTLCAITGVAADSDDDGAAASDTRAARPPQKPTVLPAVVRLVRQAEKATTVAELQAIWKNAAGRALLEEAATVDTKTGEAKALGDLLMGRVGEMQGDNDIRGDLMDLVPQEPES